MKNDIIERAKEYLSSERISVICTLASDGYPHASVMHHSFDPQTISLYYSADKMSLKYKNLHHNNKSAVVVGWSEDNWITVQMRGNTEVVTGITEIADAKRRHYAIHPSSRRFEADPNTVFLRFKPTWMRFSDLGVEPAIIEELTPHQ